jgi:DUF1009 family protein
VVCELAGQPSTLSGPATRLWRLETLVTDIARLRAEGATEICLAGGIRRPALDPTLVDDATRPVLARIAGALSAGDDGALRIFFALFEDAGLRVIPAQDLRPDLLPPPGVPTDAQPGPRVVAEADRGMAVIAALGAVDVGQSCVVRAGQVLAVEAATGTDWMLASLSPAPPVAAGGVLVKAPKPAQDRRADLPAIGPGTAEGAARAGLAGIVVQAGGVMVLDLPATLAACDRAGLFLWVRP